MDKRYLTLYPPVFAEEMVDRLEATAIANHERARIEASMGHQQTAAILKQAARMQEGDSNRIQNEMRIWWGREPRARI
jgi:hypothetical protein